MLSLYRALGPLLCDRKCVSVLTVAAALLFHRHVFLQMKRSCLQMCRATSPRREPFLTGRKLWSGRKVVIRPVCTLKAMVSSRTVKQSDLTMFWTRFYLPARVGWASVSYVANQVFDRCFALDLVCTSSLVLTSGPPEVPTLGLALCLQSREDCQEE